MCHDLSLPSHAWYSPFLVLNQGAIKEGIKYVLVHAIAIAILGPLIHELGHATLAFLFFKKSAVWIHCQGLIRGFRTTYTVSYGTTVLGKMVGFERAKLLVALGGWMASTVFSMVSVMGSPLFQTLALSQMVQEIAYASSAFSMRWDPEHDYMSMREEYDIHPIVPIALMIASVTLCWIRRPNA